MTTDHEVLHPKHWKPALGYSNGMAARGRLVVTGGIIGWNADQVFETDEFRGPSRAGSAIHRGSAGLCRGAARTLGAADVVCH